MHPDGNYPKQNKQLFYLRYIPKYREAELKFSYKHYLARQDIFLRPARICLVNAEDL